MTRRKRRPGTAGTRFAFACSRRRRIARPALARHDLTSDLRSRVQPATYRCVPARARTHAGGAVHTEALNRVPLEILRARVAQEMRTAILRGDLAPGSQLNPEELSSQLGVSREQIRQAILLLRREGLVQAQANRRAIVAPVDRQLIAD